MRILLYLLLSGAMMYGAWWFTPEKARKQGLAMVAAFDEAVFDGLRERLRSRIPGLESPVARRDELIKAVGAHLETAERELENIAKPASSRASPRGGAKLEAELTDIRKIQEQLEEAQELIAKIEELNDESGLFQETGRRIIGKILPAEPGTSCECAPR